MRRLLALACAACCCSFASMPATAATAAPVLPVCARAFNPRALTGRSNTSASPTAVTARWKIPSFRENDLLEQLVRVWVAGESPSQGRYVLDANPAERRFTFDNSGEDGEASEAAEPVFIEPNTTYDLALTTIYGPSSEYPEGCAAEAQSLAGGEGGVTTRHIFGTNGALCCSQDMPSALIANTAALVASGIASDRVASNGDPETEAEEMFGNTPALASENHLVNNDVIVGNTPNGVRLSSVDTATWAPQTREQVETAARYGDVLMEVGNEMWLKGECHECAEPDKYAEMFAALSREVQKGKEAHSIPADVKLLFDLTGSYYLGDDEWSAANEGRGWLGDAISTQPELLTRIEGFTFHPYDPEGLTLAEEERYVHPTYDYGLLGLKVDYEEARELGVRHTNVYATEFGICENREVDEESCAARGARKTPAEDRLEAEAEYAELLDESEFPEVKGLWWYQAYPVEDKYSFFGGWRGGEETKLVSLVRKLARAH